MDNTIDADERRPRRRDAWIWTLGRADRQISAPGLRSVRAPCLRSRASVCRLEETSLIRGASWLGQARLVESRKSDGRRRAWVWTNGR